MITSPLRHAIALAIDENNQLTEPLCELAELHRWKHGTLVELVEETQRECMPRDKDTGRILKAWELPPDADQKIPEYLRQPTINLLDRLGQAGDPAIVPSLPYYRFLLVHGQWPPDAWMRAQLASYLWQQGVRFGAIFILASYQLKVPDDLSIGKLLADHVLDRNTIDQNDLNNISTTESGSLEWLLRATAQPGMRWPEPILVEAPDQTVAGQQIAAGTPESLRAWRDLGGRAGIWAPGRPVGDVLAISNGWQTPRQRIITLTELLSWNCGFEHYKIETIGAPSAYQQHSLTLRLREFAAWLWEVNRVLQSGI